MGSIMRQESRRQQPAEFHLFRQLPSELRLQIWEMAICYDNTPKIHYYSLFNNDEDPPNESSSLQQMIRDYGWQHEPGSPQWTRPLVKTRVNEFDWSASNRFRYLWDFGLLTACFESREVMLKKIRGDTRARPRYRYILKSDRWVTMSACCKEGWVQARVNTGSDVVCLKLSQDDLRVCWNWPTDVFLSHLPFYRFPQTPDVNIAFEFDESWERTLRPGNAQRCLEESSERGLIMRLFNGWAQGELPECSRVWLIDRNSHLPEAYGQLDGSDPWNPWAWWNKSRLFYEQDRKLRTFIDEEKRYVEYYMWDIHYTHPNSLRLAPVLAFACKISNALRRRCGVFRPYLLEKFFRVLLEVPHHYGPLPDTVVRRAK